MRGDWEQSEASAVAAGGHLVTINDAVAKSFLVPQFGGTEELEFWIVVDVFPSALNANDTPRMLDLEL